MIWFIFILGLIANGALLAGGIIWSFQNERDIAERQ